jgi:hypothetical protein
MKIVRWILVGGVVVMLLPSDEKGQQDLAKKAVSTAHYASSTCERHPDWCARGSALWAEMKKKAEFAGRVAWDIAFDKKKPEVEPAPAPTKTAAPPPPTPRAPLAQAPQPQRPQGQAPVERRLLDGTPKTTTGTLRPTDSQVPWQGGQRAEPRQRALQ